MIDHNLIGQKSESIGKLAMALALAQNEITFAKKDSINPHLKSKYADMASVVEAVKEPLNKHKICYLQLVDTLEEKTVVKTMLLHESGEYITSITPVIVPTTYRKRENLQTKQLEYIEVPDPQALGAAITYSKRYALQAICGVPSDDDDGESAKPKDAPGKVVSTSKLTQDQFDKLFDASFNAIKDKATFDTFVKFYKKHSDMCKEKFTKDADLAEKLAKHKEAYVVEEKNDTN